MYSDGSADVLIVPRVAEIPSVLTYLSHLQVLARVFPGIPDWLIGIPIPDNAQPVRVGLEYGEVLCLPADALTMAHSLVDKLLRVLRTHSGSLDLEKAWGSLDLIKGLVFGEALATWIREEASVGDPAATKKTIPHLNAIKWLSLLNLCQGNAQSAVLLTETLSQGELNWLVKELSLKPEERELRDFEEGIPSDLSPLNQKALELLGGES